MQLIFNVLKSMPQSKFNVYVMNIYQTNLFNNDFDLNTTFQPPYLNAIYYYQRQGLKTTIGIDASLINVNKSYM